MTRKFFNKKLDASIAFNDIFYSEKTKISTKYANQNNYFLDAADTRNFMITLRYQFGNQSLKTAQRVEKTDEQNRL
ncbi:MAG: TonB-dependent receptor, partial [Myroides sp.]